MRTWVDRFPGRLEYERAEFARRGLDFKLDEGQLAEQGRVVLRGSLPYNGEEVRLEVHFPDLYPYLRPEVVAPDLTEDRHQNPYAKNLCLLDPSTRAWDTDTPTAWLVEKRVPYLLDLLRADPETMRAAEVPQGEPLSSYFEGPPGPVVFVPQAALELPEGAHAGSGRLAFSVAEPPQLALRALLGEVVEKGRNKKTRVLAEADQPLLRRFGGEQVPFRWARLDKPPADNTAAAVLEAIEESRPGFGSSPWRPVHGGRVAVAAAVFQEEVGQGLWEDAWVFVVRLRRDSGGENAYLIRGQRLSRRDLADRLPPGLHLGGSTVSLVGLGSVGSGLAFELARAGVGELRGMDADRVEAGTAVRWLLGQSAAGHLKVGALARRMERDYPYTEFNGLPHRLGQSAAHAEARTRTELDILDDFLEGADLVVDATAEIGVQQVLAELAAERGIAQLYVSTTEGAKGGLVARIVPGVTTGCWMCLQLHLDDNGAIPAPPRDETATVQPRGCSTLTFRGAGFDISPVIAQGARVGAAMLSEGATKAPRDEGVAEAPQEDDCSDVFICSYDDGPVLPPQWRGFRLTPHPECSRCAGAER